MIMHTTRLTKSSNWKWLAIGLLALGVSCVAGYANVTNVIWPATLGSALGIQAYEPDLTPRISVATLKKDVFLSVVLNRAPSTSEKLALNIEMAQGQTNFFLSVFDKSTRQNGFRMTTDEKTTLISDGKKLTFTMEAKLRPNPPEWGGGFIRVSGRGRMINGVPGSLKAAVTGYVIDNRPDDLEGTTALLIRSKLSTAGIPYRVQPAN